MTERQCPLCHIHAIQSPHGQCANANCPPFEGWAEIVIVKQWQPDYTIPAWQPGAGAYLTEIAAPIVREAEPSPAPLVEVETVDDAHGDSGEHPHAAADSDGYVDSVGGHAILDSRALIPGIDLTMPAPQPIRAFNETLGNIIKAATERADKLGAVIQASSDELHRTLDAAEEVSQDMDRVTADMKTKLGLGGNGGPAL